MRKPILVTGALSGLLRTVPSTDCQVPLSDYLHTVLTTFLAGRRPFLIA